MGRIDLNEHLKQFIIKEGSYANSADIISIGKSKAS